MDEEYLNLKEKEFAELFGEEVNLHSQLTYQQGNYIERLLNNAAISEHNEREIYQNLYRGTYNILEAQETIEFLMKHQVDPISAGFNYQATDIQNKLKNGRDTK